MREGRSKDQCKTSVVIHAGFVSNWLPRSVNVLNDKEDPEIITVVSLEQFEELRLRLVAYEAQQELGQTKMKAEVKSKSAMSLTA